MSLNSWNTAKDISFIFIFADKFKNNKMINNKSGIQPHEKMEMILVVLIGVFLIYILKHECHMDDGTVKAFIEVYTSWAGYFLNRIKRWIDKNVLKK